MRAARTGPCGAAVAAAGGTGTNSPARPRPATPGRPVQCGWCRGAALNYRHRDLARWMRFPTGQGRSAGRRPSWGVRTRRSRVDCHGTHTVTSGRRSSHRRQLPRRPLGPYLRRNPSRRNPGAIATQPPRAFAARLSTCLDLWAAPSLAAHRLAADTVESTVRTWLIGDDTHRRGCASAVRDRGPRRPDSHRAGPLLTPRTGARERGGQLQATTRAAVRGAIATCARSGRRSLEASCGDPCAQVPSDRRFTAIGSARLRVRQRVTVARERRSHAPVVTHGA